MVDLPASAEPEYQIDGAAEAAPDGSSATARGGTALRRGGSPFYRQLADDLRARIVDGDFRVGEAIPSEAQLSERYRTSRITVRHALALLQEEGLVHRQQGSGSFIRPRHFAVGPRRLTSFSEEVRERGAHNSSRLLSIDVAPASDDLPLDLGPSGDAVRVERIRMADGRPIAYQVSHLPAELGDGIRGRLASDGSLYAYLTSTHGIEIDSADETYRVGAADATASELLGVRIGEPVFIVERIGFCRARRVEWTRSVVRGDDYEVHVHLRR
jgi:DNA-binding GntR family transcriptional regulator